MFRLRGRPAGAPPFAFHSVSARCDTVNVGVVGGLSRHCSRRPIAASTACRDGCAISPVASTTSGSDSPRGSCGDRGRRAVIASIESQMARASGASPGDCATAMPRSLSSCVLRLPSVVMLSASGRNAGWPGLAGSVTALHEWPVANDVGDPPAQDDVALFNRMRMQGRPAVRLGFGQHKRQAVEP